MHRKKHHHRITKSRGENREHYALGTRKSKSSSQKPKNKKTADAYTPAVFNFYSTKIFLAPKLLSEASSSLLLKLLRTVAVTTTYMLFFVIVRMAFATTTTAFVIMVVTVTTTATFLVNVTVSCFFFCCCT